MTRIGRVNDANVLDFGVIFTLRFPRLSQLSFVILKSARDMFKTIMPIQVPWGPFKILVAGIMWGYGYRHKCTYVFTVCLHTIQYLSIYSIHTNSALPSLVQ